MDCEQTLNQIASETQQINAVVQAIANVQGQNASDIVQTKETVLSMVNTQGENTADIVKMKEYIQEINTMLGLSN